MVRSSSSSIAASSITTDLASQGQKLLAKLKQTDSLTWAVLAAIVIYVAVASPTNTPTIFRNSLFRFFLFAFVVVVFLVEGPVIGTMFALAMLLPVVYSNMGVQQEGFEDHELNAVDEDMKKVEDDINTYEDVAAEESEAQPQEAELFSSPLN